ncbi:hypothetical protein ANO14919_131450 [Xylariales sp. No.14919]|nr:hypothetical protein ANO14919_131450 [Xylariales sp. No.14919]
MSFLETVYVKKTLATVAFEPRHIPETSFTTPNDS